MSCDSRKGSTSYESFTGHPLLPETCRAKGFTTSDSWAVFHGRDSFHQWRLDEIAQRTTNSWSRATTRSRKKRLRELRKMMVAEAMRTMREDENVFEAHVRELAIRETWERVRSQQSMP
jgi:hypothetical protein